MVHGIIDNQASIQDFDSPTLLKTNSSVTQQPMYCEQIVFCLAAQKRRGEGRRGVWILD
jgi:hypothetical protein